MDPRRAMLTLMLIFTGLHSSAQKKGQRYLVRTVAFYNVENLFDTQNDSLIFDDDRTPSGKDHWTSERYNRKIAHIAKVLSEIGAEVRGDSPDLIGLCEIENRSVLQDLLAHPNLMGDGYGIVHEDSPDNRGIDVALIYRQSAFIPMAMASRRLLLFDGNGERKFTRDQLVVTGMMDGERIHLIVNHWPSRSGGESRSRPHRIAAARLARRTMDSLLQLDVKAKIIIMGDLNDDPVDRSILNLLRPNHGKDTLDFIRFFNPMTKLYRKGVGSLAYRDGWNLFDQIILSHSWKNLEGDGYRFWKVGVFSPPYLVTQNGRFQGYPFRTYAGGTYTGGYSDHFPVYAVFLRAAVTSGDSER